MNFLNFNKRTLHLKIFVANEEREYFKPIISSSVPFKKQNGKKKKKQNGKKKKRNKMENQLKDMWLPRTIYNIDEKLKL